MLQVDQDSARVSFPPPFVYLGFLLLGLGAERFVPPSTFGVERTPLIVAGTILFLAGVAIGVPASGLFRRLGTNVEPWKPVTRIVSTGLFRWTRNPMYLGMALLYAGLALGLDGPLALILLPVVLVIIRTQVIAREEAYLEAKFGEEYLDYKSRVRRWI